MTKSIDLTGQKFGKWTVIDRAPNRKRLTLWNCQCDCGEVDEVYTHSLKSGRSIRCQKCLGKSKQGKNRYLWKSCGRLTGFHWSHIVCDARSRKLTIEISIEDAWQQFQVQNGRCALSNRTIVLDGQKRNNRMTLGTASLNRIDLTKGYTKDNIQWVHQDINICKQSFTQEHFIRICKDVAAASQYHNFNGQNKWYHRFLDLAQNIAGFSKDPSTRVGAVLIDDEHNIISMGYNGFPRGISDTQERLKNREIKYKYIVHAEINCLLSAGHNINGCTLIIWPFGPCENCMKMIIQTGVKRIVYPKASEELMARWNESLKFAEDMARETGVELVEI